jgi:hypothetical protein
MKLHHPTKIVFVILGLLLAAALVTLVVFYPELKQSRAAVQGQATGTCSPNSSACSGDPKLCMDLNKNLVCN